MSLATAYSTDDGATWRDALTVAHPPPAATSGYVRLRATARDSAGNTVTSTVRRACALTEPSAPVR